MKKCSKSAHHALAELNITPLLDLAFVLLVIFIITTTPVVNDLDIDLPALHERVVALRMDNPDLSIVIRGSGRTKYHHVVNVMDMLQQANVGKVNLATEPFADGSAKKEKSL